MQTMVSTLAIFTSNFFSEETQFPFLSLKYLASNFSGGHSLESKDYSFAYKTQCVPSVE